MFHQHNLHYPVLKRPNWNRPFCVKTDWSSLAKGAVLCQPECTPKAEAAIKKQLAEGSPNEFDKTVSGLRLPPLQFLLKMNSVAERSHHSRQMGYGAMGIQQMEEILVVQAFRLDDGLYWDYQVLGHQSHSYSSVPAMENGHVGIRFHGYSSA